MDNIQEIWKDVVGFEGHYQVSSFGRIRSRRRVRKLRCNKNGYYDVSLSKHGVRYNKKIHRLVASAFIQNPENKPQVNHIDFNKLNNNIKNLEWSTGDENNNHFLSLPKHLHLLAVRRPTKLTKESVRIIKCMALSKEKYIERSVIADHFRITTAMISEIKRETTWRDVLV